jgi:3-oxoacyl-(acyl-carrier-protein) synthase
VAKGIVITGYGACTGTAESAAALRTSVFETVSKNEPGAALKQLQRSASVVSQLDQALTFARSVTHEALESASLLDAKSKQMDSDVRRRTFDPQRFGMTFSASKPLFASDGTVHPPEVIQDVLSEEFGIDGERRNVVAACATGAYSVALGASWIQQGLCDAVLAGSVEPAAHPLYEAGFRRMGVVSDESHMRPFDRHRSGFVLGEGAGAIILESRDHAEKRGATIHAELTGWGWGADPHSAVSFNSNGAHIAQVIRQALRRAGLAPEQISHVNAHGTATSLNDWIETQALIKAFGPHADQMMISATKSSTGHLLGAAGSVELVLTVQALEKQFIPPTQHLDEPDPECPLDYTPHQGHSADFSHALSLSFGFGGPIGALIVSR